MSTVSVKVKIAGRYYPLSIQQEEEASLRQAEAKIQANIDAFQEGHAGFVGHDFVTNGNQNTTSPCHSRFLHHHSIGKTQCANSLPVGRVILLYLLPNSAIPHEKHEVNVLFTKTIKRWI